MSDWTVERPFKVSRNFATGERLTRTSSTDEFFTTEQEARDLFSTPRSRNECSRTLMVMHFGRPNNYGDKNTAECLGIRRYRKP